MEIRIAAPADPLYAPLLAGRATLPHRLLRVSEADCAQLLSANRVEVALLSPLSYGEAVGKAEYLILPGPALALEGYTERVRLYFRPGLRTIARCIVPSLTSFPTLATRLLLLEQFDLEPTYVAATGAPEELLRHADAVLSWDTPAPNLTALDIGEEWYNAFGVPLLLGFWVCRQEELPAELPMLLAQLAADGLPEREPIVEAAESPSIPPRQGVIHWRWSDSLADALRQTLQLLYYHGIVPHIAEVNLWQQ